MADKKLQDLESIKALVRDIECKVFGHTFLFKIEEYKGAPQLQVVFWAADAETGDTEIQYCRKFILQYTMCNSEVIRTAYKAMQAAIQHELDEGFVFRGVRIFDPHLDLIGLAEYIRTDGTLDVRIPEDQEHVENENAA
jgi:hypothetical protein